MQNSFMLNLLLLYKAIHLSMTNEKPLYRNVANSSHHLLVTAPLVTFFNLLSKIGPKNY